MPIVPLSERRCLNEACSVYKKENLNNVVGHGEQNGRRRYRCKICGRVFTITKSSPYYALRKKYEYVKLAIIWTAKGFPVVTTARLLDVKPDTVAHWLDLLRKRGKHAQSSVASLANMVALNEDDISRLCARLNIKGYEAQHRAAIAYGRRISAQIREGRLPPLYGVDELLPPDEAAQMLTRYTTLFEGIIVPSEL